MKKSIISIISIVSILISSFSVSAADVPREAAPGNASNEAIIIVESFVGDILTEVQNGLGYADAKQNQIEYSSRLSLKDRLMVIAMASLLILLMLQYGNTEICICDLTFIQIILKKSELSLLP